MKKVFVTGANGLIASRFVELEKDNYELLTPEIDTLDLTDGEKVEKYLMKLNPDVIVHFAAYTNVGEAENQRGNKKEMCWRVNVGATNNLISWTKKANKYFVQISTDMIFPGSSLDPGPYGEDSISKADSTNLTWYGYTKLEAEKLVINNCMENSAILRLIYPVRANYNNKLDYIRKPLALYDENKLYPLFVDQNVSITFIDDACRVITTLINKSINGIFHSSSIDQTTPHELYTYVIRKTRDKKAKLKTVSLDEFLKNQGNPVRYPKYGGLKVDITQQVLGMKFKTWKQIVDEMILQGLGNE